MKMQIFSFVVAVFLIVTTVIPPVPSLENLEDSEPQEWYETWSLDANGNKIDDRLEQELVEADYQGTYPIFVDYRSHINDASVQALREMDLEINYVSKYMPTIAAQGATYKDIIHLTSLPEVVMVERDYPIIRFLDVSSPATKSRPSGIYSPETAWDEGYTGQDIVIAILDTGVDDNHESLDGKFVAGVDVSNQGFDVNGNPDDGNGHGSHCAGIAMGDGGATDEDSDGEPDYQGTAPDALLIDVKIGTDLGGNLGNSIIRGIEWCRENKDEYDIRILSISFGSTSSSDGQDATSRAANDAVLEDGLILVTAAGNSGPNNNGLPPPAAADEVITVANVDDNGSIPRGDDVIASTSSRGPRDDDGDEDYMDELKPEISAPGTDIMSVQHSEFGQGNPNIQGQYVEMSGTSMACPHISGIVALMLEANPNLTPSEVKQILKDTADTKGEPYDTSLDKYYSREYGWGLVDAYGAVRGALGDMPTKDDVEIEISSPENGDTISDTVSIEGIVSIEGEVTIDSIMLEIDEDLEEVQGTDSWSFSWNTWDVENGEYTITATVTANNDTLTDTASITVTVNNTGEKPSEDSNELFSIENLQELNEVTISLIGVIAVIVIVAVILIIRKRKRLSDEDANDTDGDDYDEDMEYDYDDTDNSDGNDHGGARAGRWRR